MTTISLTFWPGRNFGDQLNLWLAEALGIRLSRTNRDVITDDVSVVGIGTLINEALRLRSTTTLYVFGTGYGYGRGRLRLPEQVRVVCLRGPYTCDMLSLPTDKAVTDGAYLFADRFRAMARSVPKTGDVGYIPHHASLDIGMPIWLNEPISRDIIDPRWDIDTFVRATAGYRRVVTECLHGAILADILRIPFVAVQSSPRFHSFKWFDWMASLSIRSPIWPLRDPSDLADLDGAFTLSDRARQAKTERRLRQAFESLDAALRQA